MGAPLMLGLAAGGTALGAVLGWLKAKQDQERAVEVNERADQVTAQVNKEEREQWIRDQKHNDTRRSLHHLGQLFGGSGIPGQDRPTAMPRSRHPEEFGGGQNENFNWFKIPETAVAMGSQSMNIANTAGNFMLGREMLEFKKEQMKQQKEREERERRERKERENTARQGSPLMRNIGASSAAGIGARPLIQGPLNQGQMMQQLGPLESGMLQSYIARQNQQAGLAPIGGGTSGGFPIRQAETL
jgi:hypothetical protein